MSRINIDAMTEAEKRQYLKKLLTRKAEKNEPEQNRHQGEIKKNPYQFSVPEDYVQMRKNLARSGNPGIDTIYFNASEGINNHLTRIDGKQFINFSSYNYLGMSGDPFVSQAAKNAVDRYGTSVSASRIASGERGLHRELEAEIAALLQTEDAVVFVGGFLTNETVIGHVCQQGDLVVYDSFIHASIQQGARLSGADVKPFPHNNWEALDRILKAHRNNYQKILIVIEGVYSMDGDIPDLNKFIAVKKRHYAILMVDEAHSMGVLGKNGCGIREHFNVAPHDVDFWMGTLSKSFAGCGGYIASSSAIIAYLKYTTPGFVFSVGMTPPDTAAALAAIQLMKKEPERVHALRQNANLFLELAKKEGLNTGTSENSAVVPVIMGNTTHCIKMYEGLYQNGILALPVLYPAVPENASRIRFFISATHTEEQIKKTVHHAATIMHRLNPRKS